MNEAVFLRKGGKGASATINKQRDMKNDVILLLLLLILGAGTTNGQNAYSTVSNDSTLIVDQLRRAAEQGDAKAQYNLGVCYYEGKDVPLSDVLAVMWWRKAADQGYVDAQYKLGRSYAKGDGVEQDYEKAVEWWTKAAEQGDTGAQCNLGVSYAIGNGVEQDYKKAVDWYTKAAVQGNAGAQCNLGSCYMYGNGVEQEHKKAVEWWTKAAKQGYAEAQCNLGLCYEYGDGVKKDHNQAVEWWTKAAEQGVPVAQYHLGNHCLDEMKNEEAIKWYVAAAEQGFEGAIEKLRSLYVFITGEYALSSMPVSELGEYLCNRINGDTTSKSDTISSTFSSQVNSSSTQAAPQPGTVSTASGTAGGHKYVDLGLSVKWAICNVGASAPADYGNYYAWGETEKKSQYIRETSLTIDRTMGDIAGDPELDVAREKWGGTWRMPTAREIDELIEKCEWTWITIKGHSGCKVTGPNGNSIFLPAAGLQYRKDIMGKDRVGYYWSSTPRDEHYTTYTCLLRFVVSSDYTCMSESREMGMVIRPVLGLETEEAPYIVINEDTSNKGDDLILDVPEESAEFPGDVFAWLAKNVRYPDSCLDEGFQGKVVVSFVITQDGSIIDVSALRSPHEDLSKEAERVIKTMPKWKPARQGGKPVRMRYTLPIIFKLN